MSFVEIGARKQHLPYGNNQSWICVCVPSKLRVLLKRRTHWYSPCTASWWAPFASLFRFLNFHTLYTFLSPKLISKIRHHISKATPDVFARLLLLQMSSLKHRVCALWFVLVTCSDLSIFLFCTQNIIVRSVKNMIDMNKEDVFPILIAILCVYSLPMTQKKCYIFFNSN
jgi:hypothetical protein